MEKSTLPTSVLLEMYPRFKPAWESTTDTTVRYYVRQGLIRYHQEILDEKDPEIRRKMVESNKSTVD